MNWDSEFAIEILPRLLEGLKMTLILTGTGMAIALTLGLGVAVIRNLKIPVVSRIFDFYVAFIRGTPLLVQAYCVYFILPAYGIRFDALLTGILVIGINYSAYTAEVYRSGIQEVPAGQFEAAKALNLPGQATWTRIILPQAFLTIIPVLGNYFINMLKDSAVLSAITIVELLAEALRIGSGSYRYLEPLTIAGLIFLVISYLASRGLQLIERKAQHNATR